MPRFESIIENDFFNPDSSHTHDGVNSKKIKYSDLEGTPSLDFIPNSAKGAKSGVAPLDTNKKVPKENLPTDTVYDINYTHTDNNFTNALKTKLDNIEANSQVNDIETISAGNTTLPITNKNVDIPIATKTQLGLIKVGKNLSVTTDGVLSASGGTSGGVGGDTLPIGSTVEWWSEEIPENWLVCNGQAVSRMEYEDLFNVLGTTFGVGDGSTTFNLPDIKGKTLVGQDEDDADLDTIGKTGGEKTHTLTIDEMASHNHIQKIDVGSDNLIAVNPSSSSGITRDGGGHFSGTTAATKKTVVETENIGGNQPHNNMQPYFITNYIIKAKQSAGVVATVVDALTSASTIDALSAKQGKILNDKITNTNTYSTEEVNTGKKWIDGKDIYRKVIELSNIPESTTEHSYNVENIDKIVNAQASWYDTLDKATFVTNSRYDGTSAYIKFIYLKSKFKIETKYSWSERTSDVYVIIEYTKTN